jgi:N-acetylmuramoyl-L-alanine amidase
MRPYVIRTGEHLDKVALSLGFDLKKVWNDPANKDLRELRQDWSILAPGDVVQVPDEPPKRNFLSVQTGAANGFSAKVPTVDVSVRLLWQGRPLAGAALKARELPERTDLTTDGDGVLSLKVPVTLNVLTVDCANPAFSQELRIGYLDPASTPSGLVHRLANLGHLRTIDSHGGEVDEGELASAIRRFQWSESLPITGEMDAATRDKLTERHGC